ncbi:MAG: Dabb family protein [Luteolibacter sp.]
MVRHFGVFQFKPEITPAQIDHCFVELEGMVGKIPGLLDIEHGPYQSDEGLNEEFTHGFIMTFDTLESRDAYLPHPVHEAVKDIVVPCLERVVVFDFEVAGK